MGPAIARESKAYAHAILPAVVKRKFPGQIHHLAQKLKRWWRTELNHKQRGQFRLAMARRDPLPERFHQLARDHAIITKWPLPKQVPIKRKRHGKPHAYWAKYYRRQW